MIIINEFRVTPDGKTLIIDVQIDESDYYNGGVIESVILDTNLGSKCVEEQNKIIQEAVGDGVTQLRISLDVDTIGNEVIFYINAFGNSENIKGWNELPCYLKITQVNAFTYNKYPIYKNIMCLTRELVGNCNIPMSFIDYILKLKALEAALNVGNNIAVNKYWKQLIKGISKMTPKQCGCNG